MSHVDQMRAVWAKAKSVHQKQFEDAGQLSKVDPAIAKSMMEGGSREDKISVSKGSVSASQLKPSQTTMVLAKSIGMALFMIKSGNIGGDLGAIISSDKYIMDGHHRWSAAVLAGGSSVSVGGFIAKIKGADLIKVLNVITKGKFKVNQGNPGKGKLSDYTSAKTRSMLEGFVKNGIPGKFGWKPEEVKETLEKAGGGDMEKGIDKLSKNTDLITKSVPGWAPARSDMPVIDPAQVPSAAQDMNKGKVDWKAPFKKGALQDEVTRLAHEHPEFRADLLPLLRR